MKTIKKEVLLLLTSGAKADREKQINLEGFHQQVPSQLCRSFLIVENVKKTRGEGEDDDQGKYFEGGRAQVN